MYLSGIIKNKKEEVAAAKSIKPLEAVRFEAETLPQRSRNFRPADFSLIAEVKQKSPSKGEIRPLADFDPVRIAQGYEARGAAALSVLTDIYFGGTLEHFKAVREATSLPLLRKDFIIDHYQVYETKLVGADIILLIVKALGGQLMSFIETARSLGLTILIEVHDRAELEYVLSLVKPAPDILIGINNRNLDTFRTDLTVSRELYKIIPDAYRVISESGIRAAEDLSELRSIGFTGVLIGEYLVKNPDLLNFFYEQSKK